LLKALAIASLPLCLLAAPAAAHPHVFIEMSTSLAFDEAGLVKGMGVIWVFDQGYTEAALDGLDADGDGAYSDAELAPLTKENMISLKDYDYFTAMRFDGKKQPFAEVDKYKQVYANGRLALQFYVPLKEPVDPRKGTFSAKVYDPEFFIAIDYSQKEPYRISGTPAQGCSPKLMPLPTEEELQKTREFLAEKGPDWKPEETEEFGETFAQAFVVECAGS
jgi:ABC-type uncharacterized transport system substrate-binding protein